jgi:phage internal scaffolding protein
MKYTITSKKDIGKYGPGQYVLTGTKDVHGKILRKVITVTDETKMVEQSQAELTKVENLLEYAKRNGLLRHAVKYEGEYDDIGPSTYLEALQITAKADQMFQALPNEIRVKHGNKPESFLAWAQDPKNADEMISMGILKGNDGLRSDGTPSGAATPTDTNANGIPDSAEIPPA